MNINQRITKLENLRQGNDSRVWFMGEKIPTDQDNKVVWINTVPRPIKTTTT